MSTYTDIFQAFSLTLSVKHSSHSPSNDCCSAVRDGRNNCGPVTMVCPASAAGVISTIQVNYYVNVLEETSSGENINSCKDRTHLLKK